MIETLRTNHWESDENTPNLLGRSAAKLLRELSEPLPSGEYAKTTVGRVAKLAGLSYWRTFDLWYGKARRVETYEIEKIAVAIETKNERDAASELRELKSRLLRIESLLASGDAHFHSPAIDHARELVRQLGDKGRAVDRGK